MAMEFQTQRDSNEIFFPTIHIHDGEVHELEEFDHALYLQHAEFDSKVSRIIETTTSKIELLAWFARSTK